MTVAAAACALSLPAYAVDWKALVQREALAELQRQRDQLRLEEMRQGNVYSRDQLYHARRIDERDVERDADVARADEDWRRANQRAPGPVRFDPIR